MQFSEHHKSPIKFHGERQPSSLKLHIRCVPEVAIPFSVVVPLQDEREVYRFEIADPQSAMLQFDVLPVFGSNLIARAVLLPSQLRGLLEGGGEQKIVCALFGPQMELFGELIFKLVVVRPFQHPAIQIGGKIDTYWKSTRVC